MAARVEGCQRLVLSKNEAGLVIIPKNSFAVPPVFL